MKFNIRGIIKNIIIFSLGALVGLSIWLLFPITQEIIITETVEIEITRRDVIPYLEISVFMEIVNIDSEGIHLIVANESDILLAYGRGSVDDSFFLERFDRTSHDNWRTLSRIPPDIPLVIALGAPPPIYPGETIQHSIPFSSYEPFIQGQFYRIRLEVIALLFAPDGETPIWASHNVFVEFLWQ